jgi:AraC-like DNA-binding protein
MAVDEPTLFFYSPLMAHRFHHAPQDGADVACAAVHFERCPRHPLVQALPALTVLPLAQVPGLAVTLALLFQEADWARGGQGLIADRLLEVVLLQPQRRWSVAALAAQAAMSRSAFAHRFKQVVGVSPPDCLTDWRMVLAQQLLRQGRPVKWMAPELGYANASALSRVFAQRMGLSPRQWRAKTREGVG